MSNEALRRTILECLARFSRIRRASSRHFLALILIQGICLMPWGRHLEASVVEPQFAVTQEVALLIRNGQQAMYNCDFDSAERNFDQLIRLYPNHPAGFMYKAACIWWRCLLDRTNQELQARFLDYAKEGIARGDALVKKDPKDFYAQMFLAGIYGNQARFFVTITHSYWAAMRSGIKGDKFNRNALALRPDCYDCLIGTGSYYYAPAALPPILKQIASALGARGDRAKSLKELEIAEQKGEFASTEAKLVRLGIYYNEKWFDKYELLLTKLIDQYPLNCVFYHWLADFCIERHRTDEGIRYFSDLLTRASGNRNSQVAKGYALLERGRLELEAGAANEASLSFTEGIQSARGSKGLLAQAHLLKGLALDRLSQRNAALREYQNVLALPNIDETHKIASRFSKIPFQGGF